MQLWNSKKIYCCTGKNTQHHNWPWQVPLQVSNPLLMIAELGLLSVCIVHIQFSSSFQFFHKPHWYVPEWVWELRSAENWHAALQCNLWPSFPFPHTYYDLYMKKWNIEFSHTPSGVQSWWKVLTIFQVNCSFRLQIFFQDNFQLLKFTTLLIKWAPRISDYLDGPMLQYQTPNSVHHTHMLCLK